MNQYNQETTVLKKSLPHIAFLLTLTNFAGCNGSGMPSIDPSNGPQSGPAYTNFADARRVDIRGYNGDAMEPFVSRNGKYLLFNNLNDPSVNTDLHFAQRIDNFNYEYKGKIPGANSAALEGTPSMDVGGNLYFVSTRSYDQTSSTIYHTRFLDGQASTPSLVPNISLERPGMVNFDVEISANGNTLILNDSKFSSRGHPTTSNLVVAERENDAGPFIRKDQESKALFRNINSNALEYAQCISADGLELFFTRATEITATTIPTIYVSHRNSLQEPFGIPGRVSAAEGFVEGPTLSPDEKALYFHRRQGERFFIYRAERHQR